MNLTEDPSIEELPIDLATVFSPETIVTIPASAEKAEVLACLVESVARAGQLPWESADDVIDALMEREHYATTALGKGLALPHLRSRMIADFAGAIGVSPSGVDFHSLDGSPTRLIILVLSPFDRREEHTQIMGRLATLLTNNTLQYSVRLPRSPEALFRFLGF